MSNYQATAVNPSTGKEETADFLDDYFGRHRYGIRFSDGIVYKERDIYPDAEDYNPAEEPRRPKIMLLGPGRHGKDTVAEILEERLGLTFCSSSMFCAEKFIFEALKDTLGYENIEECYEDRFNHRPAWFGLICSYNAKDPSRLSRDIFAENDIYVGIRSDVEFDEAKREGLFDIAIWVDASTRKPLESSSSFDIQMNKADFIIDNNGTEEELISRMDNLIRLMSINSPKG